MPSNKQRRDAARRQLQRQLQRREEQEARRRRVTLILSIAGAVVVVAMIVGFIVATTNDDKGKPNAGGSPTTSAATPTPTPSPTTTVVTESQTKGACRYTSAPEPHTDLKNVGFPPDPARTPTVDRLVTFRTNRGVITMRLDGALAPCNAQSIAYLIGKRFYDHSSCHRLVTTGIYVLQCGDPTGTGRGGPTYRVKDENLAKADYTTGVVAMANAGPDTNGSQFFVMTKDSNTGLGTKAYTEIGHIVSGMNIIEAVARGGSNNANGAGDGKPKLALTFENVTVSPPVTGHGTPGPVRVTQTVTPTASAG